MRARNTVLICWFVFVCITVLAGVFVLLYLHEHREVEKLQAQVAQDRPATPSVRPNSVRPYFDTFFRGSAKSVIFHAASELQLWIGRNITDPLFLLRRRCATAPSLHTKVQCNGYVNVPDDLAYLSGLYQDRCGKRMYSALIKVFTKSSLMEGNSCSLEYGRSGELACDSIPWSDDVVYQMVSHPSTGENTITILTTIQAMETFCRNDTKCKQVASVPLVDVATSENATGIDISLLSTATGFPYFEKTFTSEDIILKFISVPEKIFLTLNECRGITEEGGSVYSKYLWKQGDSYEEKAIMCSRPVLLYGSGRAREPWYNILVADTVRLGYVARELDSIVDGSSVLNGMMCE